MIPILANNVLQGLSLISSLDWLKDKLKDNIMTESEIYQKAYRIAQDIGYLYKANPIEFANVTLGVAKTESRLNPNAKNKKSTARGLMQLLICTQRWMEKKNNLAFAPASVSCKQYPTKISKTDGIYNPDYALLLGMHYLGYQYKRYGNWKSAIYAYNQGSTKGNKKAGNSYLATVNKNMPSGELAYAGETKRREFY